MNLHHRNVGDFRLKPVRKFNSHTLHRLLLLSCPILLLSQVVCLPRSSEPAVATPKHASASRVGHAEWQRDKDVDKAVGKAVIAEEHPVIFYKEDFVNEDYDPKKDKQQNTSRHHSRKYKEMSRRNRHRNHPPAEHYSGLKPEKIYFDVLPKVPVVVPDDSSAGDSQFDPSRIRVELVPLVDDRQRLDNKELLRKGRPKKYRHRQRRDTSEGEHRVLKRNPSYLSTDANSLLSFLQNAGLVPQEPHYVRHPVKGIYHNPVSLPGPQPSRPVKVNFDTRFGDENETDRVVWRTRPLGSSAGTTQRPIPPLFHDPSPENWDTSFLSPSRGVSSSVTTERPIPPLFHNSDPSNWDTSFLTRRPISEAPPTPPPAAANSPAVGASIPRNPTTRRPPTAAPTVVSNCIWAIVQCCVPENPTIRYQCFEANGCYGAFWGLNPCAERTRNNALNEVEKYLNSI